MSAALRTGTESFLARFEGLRARLPGDLVARQAAAEAFRSAGLPTVRDEAWKYTSLRPLADNDFREALTSVEGGSLPKIPAIEGPRAVFVDGRLRKTCPACPTRCTSPASPTTPASAPCPAPISSPSWR